MKSPLWRVGQLLAALQLIKALELHGVYVLQFARITGDQPLALLDWFIALAALLLLVLPIAALVGLLRDKAWGFVPLVAFPFVATVFGAIPVPFLHLLFAADVASMNKIIIAVNLVFVGLAIYLYTATRQRPVAV